MAVKKGLSEIIPLSPNLPLMHMTAGPVVTDNGNFVIDAPFEKAYMKDPPKLLQQIKLLTGVVEVGLFCNVARAAYFGNEVRITLSSLEIHY